MKITKKSEFTGKENTMDIDVTQEQLDKCWSQSPTGTMHIQDALPHLTADEREFLMTGATPEEWDAAFGSEEDS